MDLDLESGSMSIFKPSQEENFHEIFCVYVYNFKQVADGGSDIMGNVHINIWWGHFHAVHCVLWYH